MEVTGEYAYNGSASIGHVYERRTYVLMDDDSQLEAQYHQKKGRTTATKTKMPQELGEERKSSIKGCDLYNNWNCQRSRISGIIISGGIPLNANINSIVANTVLSPSAMWGLTSDITWICRWNCPRTTSYWRISYSCKSRNKLYCKFNYIY